ncbi:MAG: hypothetical protein Q8L68_07475 [Methylococcales bacterium]|nr:hypothetical protein [Methylococcales bacterium]
MSYEACLEELEWLKSIDASLKKMIDKPVQFIDNHGSWIRKRAGNTIIYEQTVTYVGATQTVNLDFPRMCQLNLIELMWSDATAKDFYVRVYSSPGVYYIVLDYATASIITNEFIQGGQEYDYPTGARLQFFFENYTAGKIVKLVVHTEELV